MAEVELLLQGFSLGTDQGSPAFCGVTLVRGSRTILVDVAHTGRRELLLAKLRERGLRPQDIDVVVLTHAHWDHMLNIDLFTNAEVLVHEAERAYAGNPDPADWATPSYTGLILERMKLHSVQEGDEIDKGVRILATPGHTVGSMTLLVENNGESIGVTGDALPNARCALAGTPYLIFATEAEARESARKITSHCSVLYPGHDRPFRLKDGTVEYLIPTSIRITSQIEPSASDAGITLHGAEPRGIWVMPRAAAVGD